ncbi:MAG: 4Fe-4S binding protein, partial [Sulfuricurvum sp.]
LFLSFLFAFSVVAYGVDTAELRQALINLSFSGWLVIFFSALMAAEVFMIQGWYCAYLCPYGAMCAILPIEDRLTYRFNDPKHHCTDCAGCVKICPIPDLDIRKGFDPRCIQCGLCRKACEKTFAKHPTISTLITRDTRSLIRSGGRARGIWIALVVIVVLMVGGTILLSDTNRLDSCRFENRALY